MTVAEISEFRDQLRAKAAKLKVVKNRLFKLALANQELQGRIDELLQGPTSVAFAFEDPVSLAKAVIDFASDHDIMEIKGGLLGASVLDPNGVKRLSKMPGLTELRGMLAVSLKGESVPPAS